MLRFENRETDLVIRFPHVPAILNSIDTDEE